MILYRKNIKIPDEWKYSSTNDNNDNSLAMK